MEPSQTRKYKEFQGELDEFFLEDQSIQRKKYFARKSLGMTTPHAPPAKHSFNQRLRIELYRSGSELQTQDALKRLITSGAIIAFVTMITMSILFLHWGYGFFITSIYSLISLIIGFAVGYPLSLGVYLLILNVRIFKRKLEVEKVLPDFLRMVASNYRSGLPLDEALIKSIRPRFGVLSKEVELVAKSARVKGDLAKALEILGKKFNSVTLQRSMVNFSTSVRTGSNISQLLEEIASNIVKMRNIRTSMAASVKNYIIFIVFASIIIAPLMFSVSFTMNDTIKETKESITLGDESGGSTQVGSFTFDPEKESGVLPQHFTTFAMMMLITNSIISSLLISIIKHGNVQQGIRFIPLFLIIGVLLYFLGNSVFSFALASLA